MGVTDENFTPARKADSGGKMSSKLPAKGGQKIHHVIAIAAAKRAMFLPMSIQRFCIRKLQHNQLNGVQAEPLNQLRILCYAHCVAKIASLAAFAAHFDANPNAASDAVLNATHDANFVAKSRSVPFAAYASN